MTDPFALIAEQCKYSDFLEDRILSVLTGSQDLPMSCSDDDSSVSSIYDSPDPIAPTGIIIRSLPDQDKTLQADEEEELHSHAAAADVVVDGVVDQSELGIDTVELGRDTDLLFSEENLENKSIFTLKLDENDSVVGGEVGREEVVRVCTSGVKRNEPLTQTELENTEKSLNDSIDVEKQIRCPMKGIEDGGPDVQSNVCERVLLSKKEVNPVASTEKTDLNCQEVEHSMEINEKNVRGSNIWDDRKGEKNESDYGLEYVKLDDLLPRDDGKDFNLLETAIKGGMLFPRPSWWRPEGYDGGLVKPKMVVRDGILVNLKIVHGAGVIMLSFVIWQYGQVLTHYD